MGKPILFYSTTGEYGCFSNFYSSPFTLGGKTWNTVEHCFQAKKFAGTSSENEIRKMKSPMMAARAGRSRKRPLRKDWENIKDTIMRQAVMAKFSQNDDLKAILMSTGDSKLIEHTANDSYWGDGGDGSGKNMLGRILMETREAFRDGV